eukprot:TRINITY_DN9415_c0_g1_i13.p1 TRINITY_DN9415_c0_g1~~TRINITY_DN9415_c0_g1_i13.p1  ORF type:complete len:406 (-),score=19.07 TRINITY_DN9415_c0_g1_i13:205-1422(-)
MFGQRLQGQFRKPKFVFLDKLCIHQVDEAKKAAGILGLAGFLRASQRLVLVWSPRYFSRLWCTYELVTWCFLHGVDTRKVCFLPVASCILQCTAVASFTTNEVARAFLRISFKEEHTMAEIRTGLIIALLVCVVVGVAHVPMLFNLRRLKEQVHSFRIRDSKCFCCTHNHIHPETGHAMSCDRKLVYTTLYKWYLHCSLADHHGDAIEPLECMSSKSSVEDALDCFDEVVVYELSRLLGQSMRKNNDELRFLTYQECVCAAVPAVWTGFDYTCTLYYDGRYLDAFRWLLEYFAVPLFIFPVAVSVSLTWAGRMERITHGVRPSCCRTLTCSTAFAGLFFATMLFLWLPGQILTLLSEQPSLGAFDLLLLLRIICLAGLTIYVMRSPKADSYRAPRLSVSSSSVMS